MGATPQRTYEPPPRTIFEALQRGTAFFERKGVPAPRLEAEVLVAHALGKTRVQLYTDFDQPIDGEEIAACRELLRRRANGEPTAYLTGEKEFWSVPLAVDARVLIPRPDTERVVEAALERGGKAILELGTGSACIAIALARELPEATLVATDLSPDALGVARANVERHGLEERIELLEGDLFEPVGDARFDLIVSNPPYIPHLDVPRLQPEIAYHEPRLALDGGDDGLDVLRRLIARAPRHLEPGGWLLTEFGQGHGRAVGQLAAAAGLTEISILCDLAGNERLLAGRRPSDG